MMQFPSDQPVYSLCYDDMSAPNVAPKQLSDPVDPKSKDRLFQKGLDAFNSGRFYDAHEEWEEVWLETSNPEKIFLQGLIQVAAAYHHYLRSNARGTRTLLREGTAKLNQFPDFHRGIELRRLLEVARIWLIALERGELPDASEIPLIGVSDGR
jgi:hypothetical protein